MLNTRSSTRVGSFGRASNNKQSMPIFANITFCATCISSDAKLTEIFKMVHKMGGLYSTDLSSAVDVLVLDSSELSHEILFSSRKYKYVVDHRPDVVVMDLKALRAMHFAWMNNSLHPYFNSNSTHASKLSASDMKLLVLKLVRRKFAYKPLELLLKKYIFIGRVDFQDSNDPQIRDITALTVYDILKKSFPLATFIGDTKDKTATTSTTTTTTTTTTITNTTARAPVIDYQRYMTSSSKNESVFITTTLNGTRTEAAKQDGVPLVHPRWVMDCELRGCLIDYNHYLLKNFHKNNQMAPYSQIGVGANLIPCWNDLIEMRKEAELHQQKDDNIFDFENKEDEIILDNSNMVKTARNGTVWNKMIDKSLNPSNDTMKQMHRHEISNSNSKKDKDFIKHNKKLEIFTNCSFYAYQFNDKHYKILDTIIAKNGGFLQKYNKSTIDDLLENTRTHSVNSTPSSYNSTKTFIIVPHNFQVDFLPDFLWQLGKNQIQKSRIELITEFFIERCLHYNQLVPLDHWCKPFFTKNLHVYKKLERINTPNKKYSKLNLAITGFQGVELLHLTKILNLINTELPDCGLHFSQFLNKKTDLLLINLSFFHNTIPRTNALWYKNKYADLFEMEYQSLHNAKTDPHNDQKDRFAKNYENTPQRESNVEKLHKDSVKKKLEFIKKIKPIPSCTPGVLFEIFEKALNKNTSIFAEPTDNEVHLNDKSWCVTCPKKTSLGSSTSYDELIWQVYNEKQLPESMEDINTVLENKKSEILPELSAQDEPNNIGKRRSPHNGEEKSANDTSPYFKKTKKNSASPSRKISDHWVSDLMNNEHSPVKRKRELSLEASITKSSITSFAKHPKTNVSRDQSDIIDNQDSLQNPKSTSNAARDEMDFAEPVGHDLDFVREPERESTQLTYGESAMDAVRYTSRAASTGGVAGRRRITRQQMKSASDL
ncbi:hypothetical protein ACO0RG_004498 [Hanseniaspora osmophila]